MVKLLCYKTMKGKIAAFEPLREGRSPAVSRPACSAAWFALEFRRGNTPADGPPLPDNEVRAGSARSSGGPAEVLCLSSRCGMKGFFISIESEIFGGSSMKEQLEKIKQEALAALGELNGKKIREDLVDTIFSRFCVGK